MYHVLLLNGNEILNSFFSGQRSSSLHYAACFGRPQIAKVLLRHGANPDLRDEDGKTPLDKARERNDEGHREVAAILQSPAEWLVVADGKVDIQDLCFLSGRFCLSFRAFILFVPIPLKFILLS